MEMKEKKRSVARSVDLSLSSISNATDSVSPLSEDANTNTDSTGGTPDTSDIFMDDSDIANFKTPMGPSVTSKGPPVTSVGAPVMSSNRKTRLMEKKFLSDLNDRLAAYIDKVRMLEAENRKLTLHMKEVETVEKKEREELMKNFEDKISYLRGCVDALVREKAQLQIDLKTAGNERDAFKAKIVKLEKDLKDAEEMRGYLEGVNLKLKTDLTSAANHRRLLEGENKKLLEENKDLKEQGEVLRKHLDAESVANTSLINEIQTIKEDYDFLKKTHEKQLEESVVKRQTELTVTVQEMERAFESRLQEQVQAMRADFDRRLANNRRDIDDTYKRKLAEAGDAWLQANKAREDSVRHVVRIQELEKTLETRNSELVLLNKKISDLEAEVRGVREDAAIRLQLRDERVKKLENDMAKVLEEYQDLFELKVQLDTELKAYQNLLEGEENRLNISRSSSSGVDGGGDRARSSERAKRKHRNDTAELFRSFSQSDCEVTITGSDPWGEYIKLENTGNADIPIGDWTIYCHTPDSDTTDTSYKFHSRQILKSGESISVYSANAKTEPEPPKRLVMKTSNWPVGSEVTVSLLDNKDKSVATLETVDGFRRVVRGRPTEASCTLM